MRDVFIFDRNTIISFLRLSQFLVKPKHCMFNAILFFSTVKKKKKKKELGKTNKRKPATALATIKITTFIFLTHKKLKTALRNIILMTLRCYHLFQSF